VLAAALATAPARAAPESNPRLHVKLAAPGGCSIAEPITREVERLLGHTKPASKQLDVDLVVLREQTRLYRLVIETADENGGRFRRELSAAACDDFVRPAAVVIALAINPDALADPSRNAEPRAKPANDEPALRAPTPTPEPTAPNPAAIPPEVPSPKAAPTVSRRALAPEAERGTAGNGSHRARPGKITPFLGAAGVVDIGALPTVGLGPAVSAGLGWRWLRVEATALYLTPRHATSAADPEKGADIDLMSGALSACAVFEHTAVELGGCLGGDAGLLRGQGVGVDEPKRGSATWLAGRAGGLIGYSPEPELAAVLRGDLIRRIGTSSFDLQGIGRVHQPASWGFRCDLGLEYRFR
jgi:hypothetical protein